MKNKRKYIMVRVVVLEMCYECKIITTASGSKYWTMMIAKGWIPVGIACGYNVGCRNLNEEERMV